MANAFANFKNAVHLMNKIVGTGSAPTAVAGTGAGTSPTITVTGNDVGGTITVLTGTSPAASNAIIATLTFASAGYPSAPNVGLCPVNAAAAALSGATSCFVDSASTTATSFVLKAGSSALTGATTYIFTYDVTG